jgi:superfamily II DNA/RNA helicase
MSFDELGLSDKVLQAVKATGYTEPTPIQSQAIPHILARRDVLGIAQTGTGKTAAFTLPMLTLLETGRARARMPRTLILEPTRELAAQVVENFERYGINQKLTVALLIGGVSFADQDVKITRGVDVLIATPGRLLDHFERGKLLLNGVELLVIDEADRMLDMGFIPDIERIVKMVPFTRQTLFFSATMPPEIQRLADQFLHNAVKVEVARPASAAATISQRLIHAGKEPHTKRERLRAAIRGAKDLKNAIIFCNRKRDVALLHKSLVSHGFNAAALHGDMDQRSRTLALDSFRNGEVTLLVASDVAARGLDIPAVSHVINFDVPHHAEDYVHRIGRTGRAGRSGASITLVTPADQKSVAAIEHLMGQSIVWEEGEVEPSPSGGEEERPRRGGRSGERERGRRVSIPRDEAPADEAPAAPRAPRAPRGGRPERAERRPAAAAPATERPPRDARPPRDERPARAEAPPRDAVRRGPERPRPDDSRPQRSRDREDANEPQVLGLGDHIPAFLMRSTAVAPKKK